MAVSIEARPVAAPTGHLWPARAFDRSPPPRGEVYCWRVAVEAIAPRHLDLLFALLEPEERARADRFARGEDRTSFTAAHGGLRLLLGTMMGEAPSALRFAAGAYGKPHLAEDRGIAFNMSHSGGIVLIALARDLPIGVDVEKIRPLAERAQIVGRYLHPGEAAELGGFPDGEAEAAFFRCWARKEAVVKALGRGMSLDLDRYRVSCAEGVAPAVLALEGEAEPSAYWSLRDLEPGPAHVGALAARATGVTVSCRGFDLALALGGAV